MSRPTPQVQALIEAGYRLHQQGQLADAAQHYREALRIDPDQAVALQLIGLVQRSQGALEDAQRSMRRSLQIEPRQPHVWSNLANTLEDLGELNEALQCVQSALQLQATSPDAWHTQMRIQWRLGHTEDARKSFERALQLLEKLQQHPTAALLVLGGQILVAAGDAEGALRLLEQACAWHPGDGTLHHNRGLLLHQKGRSDDALAAYDRAHQCGLRHADAAYNRGNALQCLGRLEQAESAYVEALALDPLHALGHWDLARLRWRRGDPQWDRETRLRWDALATPAPADPMAAQRWAVLADQMGLLQWRGGAMDAARTWYERALQLAPSASRIDAVARCKVRSGAHEAGMLLHRDAVQASSDLPDLDRAALLASAATSALLVDDLPSAAEWAEVARKLAPADQYTWALQGLVWRAQSDSRRQWLEDLEQQVQVFDLPCPAPWSHLGDFLAKLAEVLQGWQYDQQAPIDQTLRGGTQTQGQLFDRPHPMVQALMRFLQPGIDSAVAAVGEWATARVQRGSQAHHPLFTPWTGRWRYSDSWSSRLSARGHHTNHVHPHGWLSAVLYVEVPHSVDAHSHAGWLQLGEPDEALAARFPPVRLIQPKPGRLVVFPSYCWHGTRPFSGSEVRSTVAFDILPA